MQSNSKKSHLETSPKKFQQQQIEVHESHKSKVIALETAVSDQTVSSIELKRCKDLLIIRTQELDE